MKVIDLLNKIAKGEIEENTIFAYDNGYEDYCNTRVFFTRFIVDKYNLNLDIKLVNDKTENTPIEKIEEIKLYAPYPECEDDRFELIEITLNKIINRLNSMGGVDE